jgi:hypothetical protein
VVSRIFNPLDNDFHFLFDAAEPLEEEIACSANDILGEISFFLVEAGENDDEEEEHDEDSGEAADGEDEEYLVFPSVADTIDTTIFGEEEDGDEEEDDTFLGRLFDDDEEEEDMGAGGAVVAPAPCPPSLTAPTTPLPPPLPSPSPPPPLSSQLPIRDMTREKSPSDAPLLVRLDPLAGDLVGDLGLFFDDLPGEFRGEPALPIELTTLSAFSDFSTALPSQPSAIAASSSFSKGPPSPMLATSSRSSSEGDAALSEPEDPDPENPDTEGTWSLLPSGSKDGKEEEEPVVNTW